MYSQIVQPSFDLLDRQYQAIEEEINISGKKKCVDVSTSLAMVSKC